MNFACIAALAERRNENGVDYKSCCHMAYHFSRSGRDRDIHAGADDDLVRGRCACGDCCGSSGRSGLAAGFNGCYRFGSLVILYKAGGSEIF